MKENKTEPRRNISPIKVWVNQAEKDELVAKAQTANLSLSTYLRTMGLNGEVKANTNLDAVHDLVRINGDLGRVAGLLKLWLATKRGTGAHPVVVENMMQEFRELQNELRKVMARISK